MCLYLIKIGILHLTKRIWKCYPQNGGPDVLTMIAETYLVLTRNLYMNITNVPQIPSITLI